MGVELVALVTKYPLIWLVVGITTKSRYTDSSGHPVYLLLFVVLHAYTKLNTLMKAQYELVNIYPDTQ